MEKDNRVGLLEFMLLCLSAAAFGLVSCADEAGSLGDDDTADDDVNTDEEVDLDTEVYDPTRCEAAGLEWKTGALTTFESYPDPESEECIEFNGCEYVGLFAGCNGNRKSENWVKGHNITSVFPNFNDLARHDLCVRYGSEVIVVTVLDLCSDADCDGCCTNNKGDADQLIDLEKYTIGRFGVEDGNWVEWADLGPTTGEGCN